MNHQKNKEHLFLVYGFAVLSCLIAELLTRWMDPLVGGPFFEFFQAAVVLSAWYGGLGPGLATATLSFLIIDYFLIPPLNQFVLGPHLLRLVIFEVVAIMTSTLNGKLKTAKIALEVAHDDLENRIEQRTTELSTANKQLINEVAQRIEAEKAILEISSREQRRLGQDLHDGLCQTLAGVRLSVEELIEICHNSAINPVANLEAIKSRLTEALAHADTISRGLYPVELEKNGLMAALEELMNKTSKIYPAECRFRCWEPVSITDNAKATHLYRIAQEAVINAIKGGKAKRINLSLMRQGSRVVLRVTDNGIGLRNSPKRNGMGLQIMKYRARVINAELKFRSWSKGGTIISCSLALAPSLEESHGE